MCVNSDRFVQQHHSCANLSYYIIVVLRHKYVIFSLPANNQCKEKKYENKLPERVLDMSNSVKLFSDTSHVTLNNKCFINRKHIFED